MGGPIAADAGDVISMGSPWLVSRGLVDNADMEIFLSLPFACGSSEQ